MLKVSAFYLESQKSFLAVVSKQAKNIPKEGASRLNFPEGFGKITIKNFKSGLLQIQNCVLLRFDWAQIIS